MGHKIIFLIGDFTATIGDPTGKTELMPSLSMEQVLKMLKHIKVKSLNCLMQKTLIKFNSEWLSNLSAADLIEIIHITVSLECLKEMILKRFKSNKKYFN